VGDPRKTLQAAAGDLRFQVGYARRAARTRQAAFDVQGDAAGIVTAVFEAFQALDQDRGDVTLSDCADDTAHGRPRL